MQLRTRLAAVAAALVFTACGLPEGVASDMQGDVPPAQDPGSQSSDALRRHWWRNDRNAPRPVVDAGAPAIDAGTTTPPVVDAGTTPPRPPPVVDAGTTPPPPPPVVDAGTTPPPPPPVVDAGTPPPPPVIDAGTTPPPPPPVVDAGSPPGIDAGTPLPPGNPGTADVTFAIDSSSNVKPISRYIYGKNFNGSTWSAERGLTLNRLGGNRWTAYNWENNASNAGSDYNHSSDAHLGGGNVPGEAVRAHVANSRAAGGATIVTVPILGWVAADKNGTVLNDPIASRFFPSLSTKPTALSMTPSLTDGAVYQDEFVAWLEATFPNAHVDPSRDILYSLDNEPDLWADTHSHIHPAAVTYAELLSKSIDFARSIRRNAPAAKILGFVSYGFNGFVSLQGAPDANGRNFIEFFLDGMRQASATEGQRLLDVLDLHWYPEAKGGNVRITGEDTTSTVVAARVQAPRSLWDPTYTESSWVASYVGGPIRLIPDVRAKIAARYPGTGLGFTEYYYGRGSHISGGVAQADVLGIFGREGVHTATLWPLNGNSIPYVSGAFAMFRNYDGLGAAFGDTSIGATNTDVANASVYASIDAANPSRMVLVVINKATTAKTAGITLRHGTAYSRAQTYVMSSGQPNPIRGADVTVTANALRYTMPAMSVTTLVLQQ